MRLSRRAFLRLSGVGAVGLVAACQTASVGAPPPTSVPSPAGTTAPAAATGAQPQAAADWDTIIAAAKQEGTVVVKGPPTQQVRTDLPRAFRDAYGIEVQYTGGQSADAVSQLQNERASGLYSTDVILAGSDSMYGPIYSGKMLDPMLPILTQPGTAQPEQWPGGKLWFMDPEQQYILRLNNYLSPLIFANTDQVSPSGITSWRDLLQPRYTGHMASFDPTTSGAGIAMAAYLYQQLGEDFTRQLLVDQNVTFSQDHRQLADWLARGTYSVVLALRDVEFIQVAQEGLPVAVLPSPPEALNPMTAGFGLLAILTNPPHPNAQKLFANWMASKDGMTVWSMAQFIVPVRNDIDKSAFPAFDLPDPDLSRYFDTFGWDFVIKDRQDDMGLIRGWLQQGR